MAQVEVLYPSDEVRTLLSAANTGRGYAALSAAIDSCRNPAELRSAILGFRRWSRASATVGEDLATVWADLGALADVSVRLASPETSAPEWPERASAETAPKVGSSGWIERFEPARQILEEAFEASAELSREQREATLSLGFSRVPREWAPLAMALRSEPHIEAELRRLLGRSPYEALEENMNALEQALPLPASHRAEPKRLQPDAATLRRLRRLLVLCMARLDAAFESWASGLPTKPKSAQSDGPTLGRRFAFAVRRAIVRACQLLWNPERLPPDPTLSEWWGNGGERTEPLRGHKAQMLDLLAVGLPLPGALQSLLLEQVGGVLLNMYETELEDDERKPILVASLIDDEKAVSELLSLANEAGEVLLVGHITLTRVMTLAAGLRRRALSDRALHRLAWHLCLAWDPPGVAWDDDWVSRWWFSAYQAHMQATRCLPSPLEVTDSLEEAGESGRDHLGIEPSEMPPSDVDASALWFLWCCLRDSGDLIPDLYRNSLIWPDCIRRLGKEGFFSTALCLFECWMVHQAIDIEHVSTHDDEEPRNNGRPDLADDALPDDDDLIGLVKDLQTWTATGRLDGLLHFTAARLGSGRGRFPYLAQQLKALATTDMRPANFHTTAVIDRIDRMDSDRKLVRDRLREKMVGYERLPTEFQNRLAEAERVRDVVVGDSIDGEVDASRWATAYGQLAEQTVRDAFERIGERELAQMYQSGGGKDRISAKSLTLGQLRFVLAGASNSPDWQDQIKGQRIEWEALHKMWRERLRWLADLRNRAGHAEGLPQEEADAWRAWMYSDFVKWIEPLGVLPSGS